MRVVIVEDEAPIRIGLGHMIQKINPLYELVGSASNGIEGVDLILKQKPDLVIMDIQMPKMDGLTMLEKVRKQGVESKVIVLSAYSDFQYAKKAIELGIVSYLLKPIRIPELREQLKHIEQAIEREEKTDSLLSMEEIVIGKLTKQLEIGDAFSNYLKENYGFSSEDPLALMLVWPGEYSEEVSEKFKTKLNKKLDLLQIPYYIISMKHHQELVLFYGQNSYEEIYQNLQRQVVPELGKEMKGNPIFTWQQIPCLQAANGVLKEMRESMEWNLAFGAGILISKEKISAIHTTPIVPPIDLENQIRQATIKRDYPEFKKCFEQLGDKCKKQVHSPKDIKEVSTQFCLLALTAVNENGRYQKDLSMNTILEAIGTARTWHQIQQTFQDFYGQIVLKDRLKNKDNESVLIMQTKQLMKDGYSGGITLEEIAHRLYVSEEYLSAQFKKETGMTFSETIRQYRIEKIKELLLSSHLKLNQIADMTGYSDPKYMSKVFKENVGMSPADFRKKN